MDVHAQEFKALWHCLLQEMAKLRRQVLTPAKATSDI